MNEYDDLESLKMEFHREMLRLCDITKKLGIRESVFFRNIREKGGYLDTQNWLSEGNPWTQSQLDDFTEFLLVGGKFKI